MKKILMVLMALVMLAQVKAFAADKKEQDAIGAFVEHKIELITKLSGECYSKISANSHMGDMTALVYMSMMMIRTDAETKEIFAKAEADSSRLSNTKAAKCEKMAEILNSKLVHLEAEMNTMTNHFDKCEVNSELQDSLKGDKAIELFQIGRRIDFSKKSGCKTFEAEMRRLVEGK